MLTGRIEYAIMRGEKCDNVTRGDNDMSSTILRELQNTVFDGCDFVVQLPESRKGKNVKILQITDMQIIDAAQRRYPDRIRPDEVAAWGREKFDALCGNHIKSLVTQNRPDLIILTGDIVYGSFDDAGTTFKYICNLMESLKTPWAPVFGNHDNESTMGVAWQCEQFEKCEYCLFKRGTVTGNGNYTVGVAVGDTLIRVLHMLDSNGCCSCDDPAVMKIEGIYPDQMEMVAGNTARIRLAQKREVPAFTAFHIPVDCFKEAEIAKGYRTGNDDQYVLGVDIEVKDNDFGFCHETYRTIKTDGFYDFLKSNNINGVFVGHIHKACYSITYKDVAWTFGLKTGQYDYHMPYQLGGMLITLDGDEFSVNAVQSLVPCGSMPTVGFLRALFAENDN